MINCVLQRNMGNETSQLKGLQIDKKSIEVTDFWSLYSGVVPNGDQSTSISVFQAEPVITGQLWTAKSPLERATRNLKIHRHPSILRFITSWEKGSLRFLATEPCRPLSLAASTQTDIQICLGLRSILCSLIFLLERAQVRHLNICIASIYVTETGAWRLNGFEQLWPAKEVNATLLERSQPFRYTPAIDPKETKRECTDGIEQYAFGMLCEEILRHQKSSSAIPNVTEFRAYCAEHLRHTNVQMRPKLSAVLLHPYFNHEFVLIHSFLAELPLKSQLEKQTFFTSLIDRLREFDEEIVAIQLTELILSRMVVLNDTAKLCVIPFILKARTDEDGLSIPAPLFSADVFTKYIIPKIQQLFLVRDSQIRLILLEYFSHYVHLFPNKERIIDHILPQLLLGIKDTNENLVASTLRCLADLIPILGSAVVIGRNRGRLFADGRPNGTQEKPISATANSWASVPRSITPVMNAAAASDGLLSHSPMRDAVDISDSYVSVANSHDANQILMPERLSPDGGEDVQTASEQPDIDDDGWSDWEAEAVDNAGDTPNDGIEPAPIDDSVLVAASSEEKTNQSGSSINVNHTSRATDISTTFIKDIKQMDIKPTKAAALTEIDDIFKDMEPVIAPSRAHMMLVNDDVADVNGSFPTNHLSNENANSSQSATNTIQVDHSRFAIKPMADEEAVADAWGDSDWD